MKTATNKTIEDNGTASQFLEMLTSLPLNNVADNARYFAGENKTNKILGVRMSKIFDLAKAFKDMSLGEVENLLENDYYEARMGAVSIMDFQARDKKVTAVKQNTPIDDSVFKVKEPEPRPAPKS